MISRFREFRYPDVDDVDVDAALYLSGFLSREQQTLCRLFHQHIRSEGAQFISKFGECPLGTQATRVLFRNFPDAPLSGLDDGYRKYMARVSPEDEALAMKDFRNEKRLTPRSALKEIEKIRAEDSVDEEQKQILNELEIYLKNTFLCEI